MLKHTGAATTVKLTLSQAHSGFASAVRLNGGETLKATPKWSAADPRSVRATISKGGRTRSLVLRNSLRPAVDVRSVKVTAKRVGSTLRVTLNVASRGTAGVLVGTVQVRSGGKLVGQDVGRVPATKHTIVVPVALKGAGKKLVVDVTVAGVAAPPALGLSSAKGRITVG